MTLRLNKYLENNKMRTFSKVSLFIGFLFLSTNLCFGQNFRLKGGIYGFPHIETVNISSIGIATYHLYIGYGYLAGIETKLNKRMTIQVCYSQTYLICKLKTDIPFQDANYKYSESIFLSEFRYYPTPEFNKLYFGFVAAFYTSKQMDDNLKHFRKDSGYKYALTNGISIKITDKINFEPNLTIWFDLGRDPSFDKIFAYPRLQLGFCVSYRY